MLVSLRDLRVKTNISANIHCARTDMFFSLNKCKSRLCVLLKLSFSVKHLFKGLIEVVAIVKFWPLYGDC